MLFRTGLEFEWSRTFRCIQQLFKLTVYEAAKHKSFHCQKEALGRADLPGPGTVVLAEGKVGTFLHLLPRLYGLLRWLTYGVNELRMSSVKQEYSRVFFWKGLTGPTHLCKSIGI